MTINQSSLSVRHVPQLTFVIFYLDWTDHGRSELCPEVGCCVS